MKALTICQPYAEAICRGIKRVENRRWWTPYRGPLLIHAGQSKAWLSSWPEAAADWGPLAYGAIVGRCELVAVLTIQEVRTRTPGSLCAWVRGHAYAEGPYCWVLDKIERLERPLKCRGALGLFDVDLEELEFRTMDAGYPAIWLPAGPPGPSCRVCGCTEHSPCEIAVGHETVPCEWVEPDLCSACVGAAGSGERGAGSRRRARG